MLSENCTEALSVQANVTISGSSAKRIKNGIAPLPFPPRAAKAILVHKARGEGQGEGTCSILCNVRVNHWPGQPAPGVVGLICKIMAPAKPVSVLRFVVPRFQRAVGRYPRQSVPGQYQTVPEPGCAGCSHLT